MHLDIVIIFNQTLPSIIEFFVLRMECFIMQYEGAG